MIKGATRLALLASFAMGVATPAFAQDAGPVPGRCGGLFCDLYYRGAPAPTPGQPEPPVPGALPCHDFVCGMFGGRTPDAPPPVQQAQVEPAPAPEPVKPHKTRKKHKAVAAAAEPAAPEPAAK